MIQRECKSSDIPIYRIELLNIFCRCYEIMITKNIVHTVCFDFIARNQKTGGGGGKKLRVLLRLLDESRRTKLEINHTSWIAWNLHKLS